MGSAQSVTTPRQQTPSANLLTSTKAPLPAVEERGISVVSGVYGLLESEANCANVTEPLKRILAGQQSFGECELGQEGGPPQFGADSCVVAWGVGGGGTGLGRRFYFSLPKGTHSAFIHLAEPCVL